MTPRHELYLLVASSLMTGDSFYESADDRLHRFRELVAAVVQEDGGADFLVGLAAYARNEMYLRTTPTILVAELFLYGFENAGAAAADRVWLRGDEHLEALAYVDAVGSKRTKGFLRNVAARLGKLSEYQFVKYASTRRAYSQRDAIRVSHPVPNSPERSALFKYVVHGWDELNEHEQRMLPEISKLKYGKQFTWEQLISEKGSTTATWIEALPLMGYMATLRNLRNLIDHNVPAEALALVAHKIGDPMEVEKSKQLPFRFLSALRALPGNAPRVLIDAVHKAADHAVMNVPELEGDSLVCVDISGSMQSPVSGRSTVSCADAASCLGGILNKRGGCDLMAFGTNAARVRVPSGNPVLQTATAIYRDSRALGWGTNVGLALQKGLREGLKRAVVLTDMQTHDHVEPVVQGYLRNHPEFMLYIVDLSSYGRPCFDPEHPNVVMVAGFSDKVFEWMRSMEETDPLGKVEAYGRVEESV
jgi:hypothetical protein